MLCHGVLLLLPQGPRCSLRSKKMYSDAYPDYLRMTALNLPAALLVLGVLFSIDDITGAHLLQCGPFVVHQADCKTAADVALACDTPVMVLTVAYVSRSSPRQAQ